MVAIEGAGHASTWARACTSCASTESGLFGEQSPASFPMILRVGCIYIHKIASNYRYRLVRSLPLLGNGTRPKLQFVDVRRCGATAFAECHFTIRIFIQGIGCKRKKSQRQMAPCEAVA
jgi:hypothetical protein